MFRVFAAALALGFAVVSCRAKVPDEAILPPETPLFVKESVGYGVVNVSFANVLEKPDGAAASTGLIRKGSVVVVTERRAVLAGGADGTARLWVFVEARNTDGAPTGTRLVAGWLPGESLDFYATLPKAETASALMSQ